MPDITIAKVKIRRGSEDQRLLVTLEQGELGYVVERDRAFVGNGITPGGNTIASKIHPVLTISDSRTGVLKAYSNDVVYENCWLYQLTGTDYSNIDHWRFIGTKPDNSTLEYNSSRMLHIKTEGVSAAQIKNSTITPAKLNSSVAYSDGGINLSNTNGLSANTDGVTIQVLNNNLKVKDGGISTAQLSAGSINASKISSSTFGTGLSASGNEFGVDIDNVNIVEVNGKLEVGTIHASNISLGAGLVADGSDNISAYIAEENVDHFVVDDGEISLVDRFNNNYRTLYLSNISHNKQGVIINAEKSVLMALSAGSGWFAQANNNPGITEVPVTTADGVASNISLSSAGFIVINLGSSRLGDQLNQVAIPIYTIPYNLKREISTTINTSDLVLYRYPYDFAYNVAVPYLSSAACSETTYQTQFSNVSSLPLPLGSIIAVDTGFTGSASMSGWYKERTTSIAYLIDTTHTVIQTAAC